MDNPSTHFLERAIRQAMEEAANEAYENIKDEFLKKLEREKDKAVTGLLLTLMSSIRVQDMGKELHVIITKQNDKVD